MYATATRNNAFEHLRSACNSVADWIGDQVDRLGWSNDQWSLAIIIILFAVFAFSIAAAFTSKKEADDYWRQLALTGSWFFSLGGILILVLYYLRPR